MSVVVESSTIPIDARCPLGFHVILEVWCGTTTFKVNPRTGFSSSSSDHGPYSSELPAISATLAMFAFPPSLHSTWQRGPAKRTQKLTCPGSVVHTEHASDRPQTDTQPESRSLRA